MKKFVLLLVVAILLLPPALVHAQQPLKLNTLEVELWPEYDRPSVLVILHLTLDASVPLPAEVEVRIPLSADVNAVASRDMDGQLLNVTHTKETRDNWQIIRTQIALAELQIEYYDNTLEFDGSQRSFNYMWPGDFQVSRAIVILQQPVDASDVTVTPGPVTSQNSTVDGLTYFYKEVGGLNAGQDFELEIGYQKSTERLTVEAMTVAPIDPLRDEEADKTNNFVWAIVLGILGLLLITGGIFWYWRTSQQEVAPRRRSRGRASARMSSTRLEAGEGIYCQQCGRRASSGDRFCRSCGTRLRLE